MKDWNSKEHVTEWVNEQPDGVNALRWATTVGRFSGQNQNLAVAWLREHDFLEHQKHEAEMRENSAKAARAAWWSARTAFLSLLIAVAALFISAWPFIRPPGP